MLLEKLNISGKKNYIILFLVVIAILLLESTYSPINFKRMHVDSSVYITIAQGITRGQLPYKDFADNKGPLAYLISVPGLYLGRFTGIWITELALMLISVFFAYKTALFFGDKYKALLGTIFTFVQLIAFLSVNAGTEEYSLPFLMISFFIFTKYFLSPKQEAGFFELVILGICFACAVMIRLNMFPLWVGFCLIVFIESIFKKHFSLLGKYVAGFFLGIIIVLIPVFLYLKLNGIIDDFLSNVIFGGVKQGFSGGSLKEFVLNFFIVFNRNYSFFPLLFGLFLIITKFKQTNFNFYTGYTISYILMMLFLSFSSGGSHYNMVLIPFFIPALIFLIDIIDSAFSVIKTNKTKNIILVLFLCFIFSSELAIYFYDLIKITLSKSSSQLVNAGKMIDDNTKSGDKIISLGYNAYIYPFTKRDAASKYIYQGSGLNQIPGARDEFLSDILTNKPAIIALFNGEEGINQILDDWHAPIFEMIDGEYRLLSDENGFKLFVRNDR
jgi:hypothetical protein